MKLIPKLGRDGRWRVHARAFLAQNPLTGKQTVVTKTVYAPTEKEALAEADSWIADQRKDYQRTQTATKPCRESLAVYGRKWLEMKRPQSAVDDLKRSTWQGYSDTFRALIEEPAVGVPRLGVVRIDQLQAESVRALYQFLRDTPNARGEQNWGRARTLHVVLRQIVKYAYSHKATKEDLVGQLRGVFGRRKRRARPEAYTGEQLVAFLKAAEPDRYRAFWFMFAFTGKRPGELLALTWPDLDLTARTMTINKRLRAVPERCRPSPEEKWEVDDPKTANSIAEVLLPSHLIPLLQAHGTQQQAEQKRRRRETATIGRYCDLVFTTSGGQPVDWNNLKGHYIRICRRARLGTFGVAPVKQAGRHGPGKHAPFTPLLKPYALRHTHATLLLEDGVPIEVVSARLGHAKTSFTYDTYIGKQTHRQHVAAEATDKRLAAVLDTGTGGTQ